MTTLMAIVASFVKPRESILVKVPEEVGGTIKDLAEFKSTFREEITPQKIDRTDYLLTILADGDLKKFGQEYWATDFFEIDRTLYDIVENCGAKINGMLNDIEKLEEGYQAYVSSFDVAIGNGYSIDGEFLSIPAISPDEVIIPIKDIIGTDKYWEFGKKIVLDEDIFYNFVLIKQDMKEASIVNVKLYQS